MTLEEAYRVGKKYGFTFNGIGPSFSLINNKVGICLNLLDQKYGYLKRNFVFDNIDDLDNFLKKYSFYIRNKDKENIFISLDDYELENPTIYYSFDIARENKRRVDKENKELLLKDIKSFLNNFYFNFDKVINEIKQKLLIEQEYYNKLNYYKKLLYQAHNQNVKENIIEADERILNKIVDVFESFKSDQQLKIDDLSVEVVTLGEVESWYKDLILKCQKILMHDEIVKVFYEKRKFEQNTQVLNQMINYLINNPVVTDVTQNELQQIKDSAVPIESYEDFAKAYEYKIKEPYLGLDINNVLSYNSVLYGATPIVYDVYKERQITKDDITEIKTSYNNLADESKRAITLLYSPLKPILNYIIEQAYKKNTSFNFEVREFKNIYDKIKACLDNSENLVFKLKYFKDIKLDNYDLFIKSLVRVAKLICSSYLKLPFDLKLYSLNFNDCLITGSDKIIQKGDDIVRIVDAKANSYVIYSPVKISINSNNNLFVLKDNENIIYFPSFNNKCVDSKAVTKVSIFEEGYSVINVNGDNLLVVTSFVLQNKVSFLDSIMTGRK